MCEQSQGVLNLFMFAEIEAGVEASEIDREPLVGTDRVIERLMEEYECNCQHTPHPSWYAVKRTRW